MGRIEVPPKIRAEDFKPEEQELINKLAGVYNNFADQVQIALNGQIDYSNLKRQIVTLDVNIDGQGKVLNNPNIRSTLSGRVIGATVLSALNLNNANVFPLSYPFISFTLNNNFVIVLNITGLQPNSQYRLTVELIA